MLAINSEALWRLEFRHQTLIRLMAENQFEPGAFRWSYQTIADKLGRGMGPVKRLIKEAVALGYVAIERPFEAGRGRINVYRIAARFFLAGKDSKSATGVEARTPTESLPERAPEKKITQGSPVACPRDRARFGWLGKLEEFCRTCAPEFYERFIEHRFSAGPAARKFRNDLDRLMRASAEPEWLARQSRIARWLKDRGLAPPKEEPMKFTPRISDVAPRPPDELQQSIAFVNRTLPREQAEQTVLALILGDPEARARVNKLRHLRGAD